MADNPDEALQALLAEYGKKLPEKVDLIEKEWQTLRTEWNEDGLKTFHKNVHNLCGSTGSYGFKEISAAARELEVYLKALMEKQGAFNAEVESKVNELISGVKKHLP